VLNGASVISASAVATVTPDWTIQRIGDFNGDGKADILWRHTAGFVHLWVLNGASVIRASAVATVPPDWSIQ
jgi:hypothetical protein